MEPRPVVRLLPGRQKRLRAGHPWAYANEIAMSAEMRTLPPGTLVRLEGAGGEAFGTAMFNPRALAAVRRLDEDPERDIDAGWLAARLKAALDAQGRRLEVWRPGAGLPTPKPTACPASSSISSPAWRWRNSTVRA